jgi:hypothetical protein
VTRDLASYALVALALTLATGAILVVSVSLYLGLI